MSYIPKYILKRMIPADAVKAVAGGAELSIVNVISPISVDEVPENVLDYLEIKLDGKALAKAEMAKIKLTIGTKTYNMQNAKEFQGQTVAVGAAIKIFAPLAVKKGETHTIDVTIKTNNPISINVERVVA
jgi:hypothetical protein